MNSSPMEDRGAFHSAYIRWVNAAFWLLLWPISLAIAFSGGGSAAFGVAMVLLCTFFVIRALSMGVSYTEDGVVARGFPRVRRWTWSDIESFSVRVGTVGAMGYRRKVLVVALRSGQTIPLRDQNASPRDRSTSSWVEVAANSLNAVLVANRSSDP